MRITWTNHGFLGFMIPLAFWALSAIFFNGVANMGPPRVAFVLAAIATWVIGNRLNDGITDDEAPHQAFGFPMQFSGPAVSAAGFVITLI